jgi:hypothetical protein
MDRLNKKTADNYIIRIYRRRRMDHRVLVVVAEEIGGTGRKAFANLDELWEILNSRSIRGKKRIGPGRRIG